MGFPRTSWRKVSAEEAQSGVHVMAVLHRNPRLSPAVPTQSRRRQPVEKTIRDDAAQAVPTRVPSTPLPFHVPYDQDHDTTITTTILPTTFLPQRMCRFFGSYVAQVSLCIVTACCQSPAGESLERPSGKALVTLCMCAVCCTGSKQKCYFILCIYCMLCDL